MTTGRLPAGFEWESRTCGGCGNGWEALAFWEPDMQCGNCQTRAYQVRMRKINETRPYTIDSIGGACPAQAEGITDEGRPFYFRARHGEWTLDVGEVGWPRYTDWPEGSWGTTEVASGDDPSNGWMGEDEVVALLDAHLPVDA